jgi:prepilin-type N-terminal cleavage/methylation domain-containing protein
MIRSRRRGLTLMELVVSLTVLAVAMTAGYAALGAVTDRRAVLLERLEEQSTAAWARDNLSRWLAAARTDPLRVGPSFRGLDREYDGLPDDIVTFVTSADTPLAVDRTEVTVHVERDSATGRSDLVASLRDWDGQARQRIVLAKDVSGIDVRYRVTRRVDDAWLTSWISGSLLPIGVEIRLQASNTDSLPDLLQYPLLVAVESSR